MKPWERERLSEEAAQEEYERRRALLPDREPHSPFLPGGRFWPFTQEQYRDEEP